MANPGAIGPPRRGDPLGFRIALGALLAVFTGLALHRSNTTTLRGDEITALVGISRARTWTRLVVEGAASQASPAPVPFLVDRAWDGLRAPLRYLGLTPPGFVRIPALVFTAGLGFAAALRVARQIRAGPGGGSGLQYVLVIAGLASFYFHLKVFAYASIERAYSLWNGLWLLLLAELLGGPRLSRSSLLLLTLMAATATGACFQILAVGVAWAVLGRIGGRPAKELLREGALGLAAPAAVGAYYALRSPYAPLEDRALPEAATDFLRFWGVTNLHVWILAGGLSAAVVARPRLREFGLAPLAILAMTLLMPLVFALSELRGYSTVSRYYIWTATAVPLAFFFAAVAWPHLGAGPPVRALALGTALLVVGGNLYATFSRPLRRNDSRGLAALEAGSPLALLLASERPARLLYEPALGDLERGNLFLIAEWIQIRFRPLPRRDASVVIREVAGRLIAERAPDGSPAPGKLREIPLAP